MTNATEQAGSGTRDHATIEQERERALFLSLIGAVIPIFPKLAASVLSGSISLYASTLKTVNEAVASLVAWIIARKIRRGCAGTYDYGMGKFEAIAQIITGSLMLVSLILLVAVAVWRIIVPVHVATDGALFGIVVLAILIAINIWFWVQNYRLAAREPSPLMDSQWRLFMQKALGNLVVLVALLISVFCQHYWWAVYIDPLASFIVIGLILYTGYGMITSSLPDLLDRTLDEELQLVVVRELAKYFDHYEQIQRVCSRRSGQNIYIDIFLEFHGEKKMSEVQESMDLFKSSLEAKISHSSVNVICASCRNN